MSTLSNKVGAKERNSIHLFILSLIMETVLSTIQLNTKNERHSNR